MDESSTELVEIKCSNSMFEKLICAIYAVNIKSGLVEEILTFDQGIEEIYDICACDGALTPNIIGFEQSTIDKLFIVPQVDLSLHMAYTPK